MAPSLPIHILGSISSFNRWEKLKIIRKRLLSKLKCPKLFFIKKWKRHYISHSSPKYVELWTSTPRQCRSTIVSDALFWEDVSTIWGSIACTLAVFLMSGGSHTFEIWLLYPGLCVMEWLAYKYGWQSVSYLGTWGINLDTELAQAGSDTSGFNWAFD